MSTSQISMISVQNLVRDYGPIRALSDVSFLIERGQVVGLLGPNGAGKTTCMKILTGFIAATSGQVLIDGKDIVEHGVEVRKRIGYLPENAPLYQDMRARDYLHFVARLRNIAPEKIKERIEHVAKVIQIESVLNQDIGTLSKGYRQRVGLAQAMIHDPEILILDEPTSGLDPNQIIEIRELIKEVGKDRTVILSTHNLHEVTATCNRILIVHKGRLIADGSPAEIQEQHGGSNTFKISIQGAGESVKDTLKGLEGVTDVVRLENQDQAATDWRLFGAADVDLRADIFNLAVQNDWTLLELHHERQDLETIFQRLTLT
ncbi:MAG: ABC transporter ATP-binding protein [Myxococcota bacterium]|nr:ATP-binding cassette domain-containing protein [Myxococcota bacterium]HPC92166.1 ATP-binding cassette domain-containing protein [Myxococcota bacterium]HQC44720.1 ATP-binding cassette domain-containing protein [Myxococcota bacterium]HQL57477.1 ATP-binding cassette domain-containing protein [Myxococcota bacterium]HRR74019.1 ATP-binding cassette domain-containing protein [Myxococcota bacterium]